MNQDFHWDSMNCMVFSGQTSGLGFSFSSGTSSITSWKKGSFLSMITVSSRWITEPPSLPKLEFCVFSRGLANVDYYLLNGDYPERIPGLLGLAMDDCLVEIRGLLFDLIEDF